jgi:hypothetical protein
LLVERGSVGDIELKVEINIAVPIRMACSKAKGIVGRRSLLRIHEKAVVLGVSVVPAKAILTRSNESMDYGEILERFEVNAHSLFVAADAVKEIIDILGIQREVIWRDFLKNRR